MFKKPIKKIALILVAFGSANLALAEESGVIVGLNVGYGGANISADYKLIEAGGDINTQNDKLLKGGGVNYGVIVGYKQFFNAYLGLRYYANLNALHANFKPTAFMEQQANITSNQKANLLNYGVNVDFLGNFVASKSVDFGAFVGVGIGGDSWLGKDLDNYLQSWLDKNLQNIPDRSGWKLKRTHFSAWANVGLRVNVAKYHGVEIFARVPFMKAVLLNKSGNFTGAEEMATKMSAENPYNIGIRYTVSF